MGSDLASMLLRKSVGSMVSGRSRCSSCERTPLAGELLHELDSGSTMCDLCLAQLPEAERRVVRSERMRAGERHLAVVTKAA
jgi:hypothetical protein